MSTPEESKTYTSDRSGLMEAGRDLNKREAEAAEAAEVERNAAPIAEPAEVIEARKKKSRRSA